MTCLSGVEWTDNNVCLNIDPLKFTMVFRRCYLSGSLLRCSGFCLMVMVYAGGWWYYFSRGNSRSFSLHLLVVTLDAPSMVDGGLLLSLLEDASSYLSLFYVNWTVTRSVLAYNFQAGSFPDTFVAANKTFNLSVNSIIICPNSVLCCELLSVNKSKPYNGMTTSLT